MPTKITLTNDFHNTRAAVTVDDNGWITESQLRRARAALCGIKGCTCGGDASERGEQEHGAEVVAFPDGGARITWDVAEYVQITEDLMWDQDNEISDEEHAAACQRAQDYCTEHEGDFMSIEWRPTHAGEAAGLYQRYPNGHMQILGYSLSRPEEVEELTGRAWYHALVTWPEPLPVDAEEPRRELPEVSQ